MLVFALSTPMWLLGAVSRGQLSADLPVSSFIWVTPTLAASILVYRENGTAGVTAYCGEPSTTGGSDQGSGTHLLFFYCLVFMP